MGKKKDNNIIDLQQYRRKRENERKKNKRMRDKAMGKKRRMISPGLKMAATFGAIALIGFLLALLTQGFVK